MDPVGNQLGKSTYTFEMMIDDVGMSEDGLPSGYVKIAIENDHRNSEFSH